LLPASDLPRAWRVDSSIAWCLVDGNNGGSWLVATTSGRHTQNVTSSVVSKRPWAKKAFGSMRRGSRAGRGVVSDWNVNSGAQGLGKKTIIYLTKDSRKTVRELRKSRKLRQLEKMKKS
jgi:hypothetical protein